MTISEVCIRRPVFTWVLVSIPVVLGVVSYLMLGVELFPKVDVPVVAVTASLPGASAEELETTVTRPLEEAVNRVSGIDELRSTVREGTTTIVALFVLEKDSTVAAQEIQEKISAITATLPRGMDAPVVDAFDIDSSPIMAPGNLGQRLLPMLSGFRVVGVDFRPPQTDLPLQFVQMDFSLESSCLELIQLMREVRPVAVVHLAFVMDAVRTGILDRDRIWQVNVAGTARVMEAVTEANREWPMVEKFIFMSSVSAYGPGLSSPATEESPLAAHTYSYGIHKMEADRVVQERAPALRGCSVYILRPHIFAGASIENYFMEAFRGIPCGTSKLGAHMRKQGKRLPCMLPSGSKYLHNRIQFVHIDDVARLIAFILHKTEPEGRRLTIMNVAGRGGPLTYEQCVRLARAKLIRVPTEKLFRLVLRILWAIKLSTIPPDVAPYMTSDTVMNTSRLENFLGSEYENVIRFPIADAFGECFRQGEAKVQAAPAGKS